MNIGATIGAIMAFLVARYLIGDWLQKRYAERLASFNKEIAENGYNYLLTLRLIPVFPFFLVNIFAGITKDTACDLRMDNYGRYSACFVCLYLCRPSVGID